MKKKLQISELKVNSFITSLEDTDLKNLKGGNTNNASCNCTPPVFPTNGCTLPLLECIVK